jgi:hypothetical protein
MEFLVMRIPLITSAALLVLALPAGAQDLQYRTRIETTAPGMPEMPPIPAMTTYIKGQQVRMDHDMGGMRTTRLVDGAAGRARILMHGTRSYMEAPQNPLGNVNVPADALRKMGLVNPIRTGERQTIAGYVAERVLLVAHMPTGTVPGPDSSFVTITETWAAADPKLIAAYKPYADAMLKWSGAGALEGGDLIRQYMQVFPLRTTTIMLMGSDTTRATAEAVLKNAGDARVRMRMVMEVSDIKFGPLPDSLFVLPKDYKQMKMN